MDTKEIKHKSLMSGVSQDKIRRMSQHDVVGPGQYHKNLDYFGKNHSVSKVKNSPGFSIGKAKDANVLNPYNRNSIASPHQTPSPMDYQVPTDNHYFKKQGVAIKKKEDRFFTPTNMPKILRNVPVQYTAVDGLSPMGVGLNTPIYSTKGYVGGSDIAKYRRANMGYGKRSDFTQENV
jgi:hypothetical protein